MAEIFIKTDSHYRVNRQRIRKLVASFLEDKKVRGKVEVNFSIVGNRQMRKLNKQYRNIDRTTDVLSFPLIYTEGKSLFIDPPDKVLRLGDIVISYPEVLDEASDENILVDDKIDQLIIHGLKHLLGFHHD